MGDVLQFNVRRRQPAHAAVATVSHLELNCIFSSSPAQQDASENCPHALLALAGFKPSRVRADDIFRVLTYRNNQGITIDIFSDAEHRPVSFEARWFLGEERSIRCLTTPQLSLAQALEAVLKILTTEQALQIA